MVLDGVVVALTGAAQSSENLGFGVTDATTKTNMSAADIASAIGKSLYTGRATALRQQLELAKVYVEVKATDSLPFSVLVEIGEGKIVSVAVELVWSPQCCMRCSVFGHTNDKCPKKVEVGCSVQGDRNASSVLGAEFLDVGQSVNVTLGDVNESGIGLGHGGQVGETSKIALLETDGSGGYDCAISNNGSGGYDCAIGNNGSARVEDSVVECVTVVGSELGVDSSSSAMAAVESPNKFDVLCSVAEA
ncbi:hypothetical protein V6N12_031942 [Hibiscus sabdariffa]|uniref:Zinc knuckle CX2CX4HX4C domain-containing protein n=1 Tax=Hibiscus sabdariffa TaxID=183260 RepID=A0ABR2BYQ7_9ROSI